MDGSVSVTAPSRDDGKYLQMLAIRITAAHRHRSQVRLSIFASGDRFAVLP